MPTNKNIRHAIADKALKRVQRWMKEGTGFPDMGPVDITIMAELIVKNWTHIFYPIGGILSFGMWSNFDNVVDFHAYKVQKDLDEDFKKIC